MELSADRDCVPAICYETGSSLFIELISRSADHGSVAGFSLAMTKAPTMPFEEPSPQLAEESINYRHRQAAHCHHHHDDHHHHHHGHGGLLITGFSAARRLAPGRAVRTALASAARSERVDERQACTRGLTGPSRCPQFNGGALPVSFCTPAEPWLSATQLLHTC